MKKMKKINPYKLRDTLCIHPWSHLAVNPDGSVIPCCHARWKNPKRDETNPNVLGNMKTHTLDEIFNGEKMKKIRHQMMNGILPEENCSKCAYYESINVKSPRQWAYHMEQADATMKDIAENTNPDGSLNDYKIRYWDLRYSNVCNMSCIMCSPEWSHKWTAEYKALDASMTTEKAKWDLASALVLPREEVLAAPKKQDLSNHLDWVDKGINDVQKIYFAGGEPMAMDEHWYILNKLDENKRYNVVIKYNTNMLKLEHRGQSAVDIWKKWSTRNLLVECSIDETGKRAEYIRYGTDWKVVSENIRKVVEAGIRIKPIISVGCYNIHRLPELFEELSELFAGGVEKAFEPTFNPVFTKAFSIPVWPDEEKEKIIENLKKLEPKLTVKNRLKVFYDLLKQPHDEASARAFLRKVAVLDISRNNSVFDDIPELEVVNDKYNDYYGHCQKLFRDHSTWGK